VSTLFRFANAFARPSRDLVRPHPSEIAVKEAHAARARAVDAVQAVEDGGLARAVRSDDREQLTLVCIERHVVERDETAEREREPLNLEQWRHR
jgi:hypothetical protein